MKRLLAPRPDDPTMPATSSPAPTGHTQARSASEGSAPSAWPPNSATGPAGPRIPAPVPATPRGPTTPDLAALDRTSPDSAASAVTPPIECEEYLLRGVQRVKVEAKLDGGPLLEIEWAPPAGDRADLDALAAGLRAHLPLAKYRDFYSGGRGRGGLSNIREAGNLHCAIGRGKEGLIVRFSSADIPNGGMATWYDNPPEKQFLNALAAAGVQLSDEHRTVIERVQSGQQREAAIFNVGFRIRYGESSSGSLIAEGVVANAGG